MIELSAVRFTYPSGIEALAEVSLRYLQGQRRAVLLTATWSDSKSDLLRVEGGEPRLSEYGNTGNETDAYRLL
jgi:hypothetical protein